MTVGDLQLTVNPDPDTKSSESPGVCPLFNGTIGDNTCQKCDEGVVQTQLHRITNLVYYSDENGEPAVFQYISPKEKSGDLQVSQEKIQKIFFKMYALDKTDISQPDSVLHACKSTKKRRQ